MGVRGIGVMKVSDDGEGYSLEVTTPGAGHGPPMQLLSQVRADARMAGAMTLHARIHPQTPFITVAN